MLTARYFPSLTIRASEAEALRRLAEPVKDAIFPIVRMQAWPHPKNGAGGPIVRSSEYISEAFGERPLGFDLAPPITPSNKVYKTQSREDWAALGRLEVAALHNPAHGFQAWCDFVENDHRRIPVIQWSNDPVALRTQVERLAGLNRGLIFRFRRSQGWNMGHVAALSGLNFGQTPILLIYDYEQIGSRADLTSIGIVIQRALLSLSAQFAGGIRTYIFKASSFPSEFTSTGEEYACLTIRERQLYEMLRASPPLIAAGIDLRYGDHAAIFASDREPAFRGVPRVDYPTPGEWIYHRRREGFHDAAVRVRGDVLWDEANLCWGAHRIREAAAGNMVGLNAAGRWTTIRMNIHMHVQAQSAGAALTTDEPWID